MYIKYVKRHGNKVATYSLVCQLKSGLVCPFHGYTYNRATNHHPLYIIHLHSHMTRKPNAHGIDHLIPGQQLVIPRR